MFAEKSTEQIIKMVNETFGETENVHIEKQTSNCEIKNEEDLQNFIIDKFADLGMGLCEAQRLLNHIIALLPSYSKIEKKTT